jgi:23S rRNA (pseudouridine1915-N3)-methyltransferase
VRIILACVGRLKAGPERDLVARYMTRAAAGARSVGLTGVEQRELDEGRGRRPEDRRAEEAKSLRAFIPASARLILLDERGASRSSEQLAADIGQARDAGASAYVIAIGGPDGFDASMREQAAQVIAFGSMTWPHQLARIMATEQIYRATTILAGHPYHRA